MQNLARSLPCLRWSPKLRTMGCGCPLYIDPYQNCTSYKCLYCNSHYDWNQCTGSQQYSNPIVHSIREKEFRQVAGGTFYGNPPVEDNYYSQFIQYLLARLPINIGHGSDPFIPEEKDFRVTLALLRMIHELNIPLSLATKAGWWTTDERYMQIFEMHVLESHRKIAPWIVRMSCSSLDPVMDKIDIGAPTAKERLNAIGRLTERGVQTNLWLKPFIPGISQDWPELFEAAAAEGANGIITEWLNLPRGAGKAARARYEEMSKLACYDIFAYYRENSPKSDQTMRLTAQAKRPIMEQMREKAHSLGMKFIVSDPHCRDLSDTNNCCGLEGALPTVASLRKPIGWQEFSKPFSNLFSFAEMKNTGLLTDKEKKVPGMKRKGLFRFLKDYWNAPEAKDSLMNLYGVQPSGRDKNEDFQYVFGGATEDVQRRKEEEAKRQGEVDDA